MKTSHLILLATAAAAIALPSLAQPYGAQGYGPPPPPPGYGPDRPHDHDRDHAFGERPGGWDIDRRIEWTQDRISRGRADGSLDRREFRRVQSQLNRIRHDFQRARYRNGGHLDDRARDGLGDRLNRLNDEIHWLRDNGEHRPW